MVLYREFLVKSISFFYITSFVFIGASKIIILGCVAC